jgi:hypothetical protein
VERIAGRYIVEATLGRGGMGVVYRVLDEVRRERVALKRLLFSSDASAQAARTTLFEREYHTLAQLRHPRIVAAYDYGLDEDSAYYTMELLEGSDLKQKVPVPWRPLCVLLRDVASALALVHARKLVHRDVTPRNIHCTADGRAKLFDFGAMTPMQVAKDLVGTPPFVPPEALLGQALDGRADLFALGATAYWALTGQHAYPAHSLDDLMDAWRSKPREPRAVAGEIPAALSELVLSMLSLDRMGRPSSAAEVVDRLETTAELVPDEQLAVAHAYLATPTLVAREETLPHVRDQLARARKGVGGFTLIEGEAGVGRSRFLEAGVLEAMLLGTTVLRADALAGDEDYSAAKVLASQLLRSASDVARGTSLPHAAILGRLLPELRPAPSAARASDSDETANPRDLRPQLQAALCDWFLEASKRCRLLVAADDVHRFDEPSAALIASLATRAGESTIVVLATVETGAPATSPAALRLLTQAGARLKLRNLAAEQTRALLVSVFGDVPNIELISTRIHDLSGGSPRACMDLAQHLVDRGAARYAAGHWVLPSRLDADDLPATMAESFASRLHVLGTTARSLAEALAIGAEDALVAADVRGVLADASSSDVFAALEELRVARVLEGDGDRQRFTHEGWVRALHGGLDEHRRRSLHRALASIVASRGRDVARVVKHLLEAGDEAGALDTLIESLKAFDRPRVRPPGYGATLEQSLETSARLGRPRRERILIEAEIVRMASFQPSTHAAYVKHVREVVSQLGRDAGLARLAAMNESADHREPRERLTAALTQTHQAHLTSPENERGLSPTEAIKELGLITRAVAGYAAGNWDMGILDLLPSLAPLVVLSPALQLAEQLVTASRELIGGRRLQASRRFAAMRERLAHADRAGLEPMVHWYTELALAYSIGLIEASLGIGSAIQWADQLEADPAYRGNAHRIRAVFHLSQGETELANGCFKQAELWGIQSVAAQAYEGTTLRSEIEALSIAHDLMGIKAHLDTLATLADRFPGWIPWLHFARGAYQRLRGDIQGALAEFEAGLEAAPPGHHPAWVVLAGDWLSSAMRLGRCEEVRSRGREWLERAEQVFGDEGFDYRICVPLALADARLGSSDRSLEMLDANAGVLQARGTTGTPLGQVYEAAAQVALWIGDGAQFDRYARLCAEHFKNGQSPGLAARCAALMDQARSAGLVGGQASRHENSAQLSEDIATLSTTFGRCHGPAERATHALQLLVQRSRAAGGHLYVLQPAGPSLVATHDEELPPPALDAWVREYLATQQAPSDDDMEEQTQTRTGPTLLTSWKNDSGHALRPVLVRGRRQGAEVPVALVVLREDAGAHMDVPATLVRAIGDALIAAGDVTAVVQAG